MNPNAWHYEHFMNPPAITPGSIMPPYAHFATERVDFDGIESKLRGLRAVGVPYSVEDVQRAPANARRQAEAIRADLLENGIDAPVDSEMIAIIAYLQALGLPAESPVPPPSDGAFAASNGSR